MVIHAGLFKVRCRLERMVHLRGRLDKVSLGPAGLSLGVFFLRRWGLGLQFVVLVWNFKNGVDGFVGLSWLLHFGVLRSLVVVFMPVLLIRDVAVSKCPHRELRGKVATFDLICHRVGVGLCVRRIIWPSFRGGGVGSGVPGLLDGVGLAPSHLSSFRSILRTRWGRGVASTAGPQGILAL